MDPNYEKPPLSGSRSEWKMLTQIRINDEMSCNHGNLLENTIQTTSGTNISAVKQKKNYMLALCLIYLLGIVCAQAKFIRIIYVSK